jgi:CheY-like chemotaxis protein/HPt (histidine-containing phosphotransfer) domain-containing protein
VDDVETNLYVSKGLLKSYGLKIETVDSGIEAVERIRRGEVYDIIFMDHMMPKMDGIEATRIIRQLGYNHPIVALTANAVLGQADVFMQNGFDDFISKPIDMRQLNASLKKFIRDKQPPEVIEAARRENVTWTLKTKGKTPMSIDRHMAEVFVKDASKSLTILESIYDMREVCKEEDLKMYIICIHSMKSALANIGAPELSVCALRLEQAGRDGNIDMIADETPEFLASLQTLIEELTPKKENGENRNITKTSGGDQVFLRYKLRVFEAACADYDKKSAKKAISDLKEKTWPVQIDNALDEISEYLLFSDFDEAVNTAKKITEADLYPW